MIEVTSVETLNNHLAGVAKVLQYADRLLVDTMSIVVLGERAIIHVGKLAGHLHVIEEVIDQDRINVPLVERALLRALLLLTVCLLLLPVRV